MRATRLTRRAFTAAALLPQSIPQTAKRRLSRAESYFGLHFDLHPSDKDPALGRDVTEEMIGRIIASARPDYIQYDSKGHAGWLGWPSRVGPSAPNIVQDSLALYRKVTAREGVALYIHFSGVWDGQAVARHPEWARVNEKGERDERNTSTFGPYVDELMIPQLREAARKYELDGAWVDGECWSTAPDYSTRALAAWKKETGRESAPKSKDEPYWAEWLEFNRRQFRQYVKHYVDALHGSHPKFQVASNWLYSTFVPEEPTLPVDFLSGDYLGNASISTARLEARYLAQTGRPWDLMAWGFQQANSNAIGHVHKPAAQLQQEASVVLAQGGGFQVYYVPSRQGHFEESHIRTMGRLGTYCRERQAICHKSETVPQIGVVFSRHSLYATSNKMFGGWGRAQDPARGLIDALLASLWSVDVIPDWKLTRAAADYPFLVLPDWAEPGEETHARLLEYARGGGRLLVAGARNAMRWAGECGYRLTGGAPSVQQAFLFGGEVAGNAKGLWQDVEPGSAKVLSQRFGELDSTRGGKPAALAAAVGKGEVVVVPGPLGEVYAATHTPALRDFTASLVSSRFRPLVEVSGPPTVEVVLRKHKGGLVVHLLNGTAMQVAGDYAAMDFIPEVGPIVLKVPERVSGATAHPEGRKLAVRNREVTLDRLHLHAAISLA